MTKAKWKKWQRQVSDWRRRVADLARERAMEPPIRAVGRKRISKELPNHDQLVLLVDESHYR